MSVTDSTRTKVRQAANNRCGYCQIDGHLVYAPMEIDHLLPQAKGGSDEEDNLWIACPLCNNAKRDIVEAPDPATKSIVPLFNPRHQHWSEHFYWDQNDRAFIVGITASGRATVEALNLNQPLPLQFRRLMVRAGWYPPGS